MVSHTEGDGARKTRQPVDRYGCTGTYRSRGRPGRLIELLSRRCKTDQASQRRELSSGSENHQMGFASRAVGRRNVFPLRGHLRTPAGSRGLPGRPYHRSASGIGQGAFIRHGVHCRRRDLQSRRSRSQADASDGRRLRRNFGQLIFRMEDAAPAADLTILRHLFAAGRFDSTVKKTPQFRQLCALCAAPFFTIVAVVMPVACVAQTTEPLDGKGKLRFHAKSTYDLLAIAGFAAYAGVLQGIDSPREWGQGCGACGKCAASTVAWSGINSTLAFGLDTTLHQDPRYYRSLRSGFWRRTGDALRGTILTRTDSGGETFSTWRVGSAFGSAFLSNTWYPDRLNTVRLGMIQGTAALGFNRASDLGSEFWPDIKRKVMRRR